MAKKTSGSSPPMTGLMLIFLMSGPVQALSAGYIGQQGTSSIVDLTSVCSFKTSKSANTPIPEPRGLEAPEKTTVPAVANSTEKTVRKKKKKPSHLYRLRQLYLLPLLQQLSRQG